MRRNECETFHNTSSRKPSQRNFEQICIVNKLHKSGAGLDNRPQELGIKGIHAQGLKGGCKRIDFCLQAVLVRSKLLYGCACAVSSNTSVFQRSSIVLHEYEEIFLLSYAGKGICNCALVDISELIPLCIYIIKDIAEVTELILAIPKSNPKIL